MQRGIVYFLAGTLIGYLLNHYVWVSQGWQIDLFNGFAIGLGWAMAYMVDKPEWALSKKLGISFIGMVVLVIIGLLLFNFETAVPSIIKFSTIFVAYYLVASFRGSKSLRN